MRTWQHSRSSQFQKNETRRYETKLVGMARTSDGILSCMEELGVRRTSAHSRVLSDVQQTRFTAALSAIPTNPRLTLLTRLDSSRSVEVLRLRSRQLRRPVSASAEAENIAMA